MPNRDSISKELNARLAELLKQGIAKLGLETSEEIQAKMLAYLTLLNKWNKVYNLTAIRDPEQMVTSHILDSLSVLPHLWKGRWLDVGCGAGLPGLVIAIAKPDWEVVLLDSNSKKISFVQQTIIELNIKNAETSCIRVEEWNSARKFDGIISRAFAEQADFIKATNHLLKDGGRWVAMKGRKDYEQKVLPADVKIEKLISLNVPGLNAERHMAILKKEQV